MSCVCKTCGGTGSQLLLVSMFMADGLRRERCGICSGGGQSSYPNSPEFVRFQKRARLSFPKHPDLQPEQVPA